MIESPEIRLRRLTMRSWRRGMKEMDLILGHFADGPLAQLSPADLDAILTIARRMAESGEIVLGGAGGEAMI